MDPRPSPAAPCTTSHRIRDSPRSPYLHPGDRRSRNTERCTIPAQLQVKAENAQVFGDELPHARLEERFVGRLMKVGWIQAAAGNYRNPFIFSYVEREIP